MRLSAHARAMKICKYTTEEHTSIEFHAIQDDGEFAIRLAYWLSWDCQKPLSEIHSHLQPPGLAHATAELQILKGNTHMPHVEPASAFVSQPLFMG